MKMNKSWFVIVLLLFLDQLTKIVARFWFEPPVELNSFLQFRFAENKGVAFSFPVPIFFLILFSVGVVLFLAWMIWKKKFSKWESAAATFIFAGAFGNLIDRIILRAVTDFIQIGSFPIFNFADIFITAGVVIFVWKEVLPMIDDQ